jgi:hypothetical protein|tara:strand:- start:628 stop:879 length:252 start_codon:yes stop_codon:yes gene_type:complete
MAFKNNAIEYLWRKALADQSKAKASLEILLDHPAGIGDHSTGDLHENLEEALSSLADAEDRLETLQRYYAPVEDKTTTEESDA